MTVDDKHIIDIMKGGVSVVGNANSLFYKNAKSYGSLIDEKPTIRFNWAWIEDSSRQGSRWDFMATGSRLSQSINKHRIHHGQKIKFHTILCNSGFNRESKLLQESKGYKYDWHMGVPSEIVKPFRKRLDPRKPSTGLHVLILLDYLKIEDVRIFGFDGYKSKTFYNPEPSFSHNYEIEVKIRQELVEKNNWKVYE